VPPKQWTFRPNNTLGCTDALNATEFETTLDTGLPLK